MIDRSLLEQLVHLSAQTQRAYQSARAAGDVELANELRECGWAVARALAKAARRPVRVPEALS